MSPVIRISDELFARLESHAKGFDSPSNVIERILNSFEGEEAETYSNQISEGRDRTKYEFGDDVYGKARLVWEVVKQYVSDNRDVKVSDLSDAFPKELQGTHGVFSLTEVALEIYERTGHKRHFIKEHEIIKVSDGSVAVCTQWGIGNIKAFLENAESLNFAIRPVGDI